MLPSGDTTIATPNVANAAAKMLAVNPTLSGAQMKSILMEAADKNETGETIAYRQSCSGGSHEKTLAARIREVPCPVTNGTDY
jgi:hypothetical protein